MIDHLLALIPGGGLLVASLWVLICNSRTFAQRRNLYPTPGDPDFWVQAAAFKSVSYERHFLALFLFQNPKRLYPPPIGEKK